MILYSSHLFDWSTHVTDRQTDKRTDRRTELRWLRRAKAVGAFARKNYRPIQSNPAQLNPTLGHVDTVGNLHASMPLPLSSHVTLGERKVMCVKVFGDDQVPADRRSCGVSVLRRTDVQIDVQRKTNPSTRLHGFVKHARRGALLCWN